MGVSRAGGVTSRGVPKGQVGVGAVRWVCKAGGVMSAMVGARAAHTRAGGAHAAGVTPVPPGGGVGMSPLGSDPSPVFPAFPRLSVLPRPGCRPGMAAHGGTRGTPWHNVACHCTHHGTHGTHGTARHTRHTVAHTTHDGTPRHIITHCGTPWHMMAHHSTRGTPWHTWHTQYTTARTARHHTPWHTRHTMAHRGTPRHTQHIIMSHGTPGTPRHTQHHITHRGTPRHTAAHHHTP